jgi:hypothetical protein
MTTLDCETDESTFTARWLQRFCRKQVRQAIAEQEPIELLATRLRELFLTELCRVLKTEYVDDPAKTEQWLDCELVTDILALNGNLSAGESLLCLLTDPIARVDWSQVAEQVQERPNKLGDADATTRPTKGRPRRPVVARNLDTGEIHEFESVFAAEDSGFSRPAIYSALSAGKTYRGFVWSYSDDT